LFRGFTLHHGFLLGSDRTPQAIRWVRYANTVTVTKLGMTRFARQRARASLRDLNISKITSGVPSDSRGRNFVASSLTLDAKQAPRAWVCAQIVIATGGAISNSTLVYRMETNALFSTECASAVASLLGLV
jgi:hypothetical protein